MLIVIVSYLTLQNQAVKHVVFESPIWKILTPLLYFRCSKSVVKYFLKKALIWVLHTIICCLLVYGHTVQLEAAWVKLFCIQKIIFISPGKIITGKQPHFVFSCWNVLSHLMTKISHIKISHIIIGISFGLFLGTTSQYLFSADTICIVHHSTHIPKLGQWQPYENIDRHTAHTIASLPWCRVLTQAWHIP